MAKRIDESGKQYGKLKVLRPNIERSSEAGIFYDCQCECGALLLARGFNLRKGLKTSCGCDRPLPGIGEIGKKYWYWTVQGLSNKPSNGNGIYICAQCDCGTLRDVLLTRLRCGHSKSCGCKAKFQGPRILDDLIGRRFGKLVVLERNLSKKNGKTNWDCRCDCGNLATVRATNLKLGTTRSCGCLLHENLRGQVFGKLTVVGSPKVKKGANYWPCECNCGQKVEKRGCDLKRGRVNACSRTCLSSDKWWETGVNELIRRTRFSAKKRGIEYSLSRLDFEKCLTEPCFYCGAPPANRLRTHRTRQLKFAYSGVDRINSSSGYTPDNISPCCINCNVAKGQKSIQEFASWIEKLYNRTALFSA